MKPELEANNPNENIAAFAHLTEQRAALVKDGRCKEAEDILQNKPVKEWTEDDWALVKEFVNASHDLVLEIRRLAAMGGPVYELDYSKGVNIELPHLAKLRDLARVLSWDATVRGHDGDYGEAVEDITAGFKLSGVLKDEPILISQLVRIAIDGICYGAVQQALPPEGVPPDLARRLIESAGRSDCRDSFVGSFSGEGFMGLDTFERIRDGESIGEQTSKDTILLRLYGSMFARPWLNMDEETYAQTLGRMGEISELPFYEAHPQMEEIKQDVEDLPRTRVFSRMLLPGLMRVIEAQARLEVQLDLVQIGLSVEQYHAQNGAYPATLDAIAPSIGGGIPVDPFTGQPYRYQVSSGGFLLYSVGADLTDDGGVFDYRKGDIVWRGVPKNE